MDSKAHARQFPWIWRPRSLRPPSRCTGLFGDDAFQFLGHGRVVGAQLQLDQGSTSARLAQPLLAPGSGTLAPTRTLGGRTGRLGGCDPNQLMVTLRVGAGRASLARSGLW
jgi:hypothetical protein